MRKSALPAFIASVLLVLSLPGCSGTRRESDRGKADLAELRTYVNTYEDYTADDLDDLRRFDIAAIEPYTMPDRRFAGEVAEGGTIVLAYVSIGEADEGRRYWEGWEPDDRALDNPSLPRTTITASDPALIGEDPGWEGSYFVDASDPTWRRIMLDEEIPYILWLGGGRLDGLMMDLVDVVDEYEGKPGAKRMRQGMIDLIEDIHLKYPDLILVPNRGFGILPEMAPYIDAFKFEEMNGAYGTVEGEPHYEEYYLKVDEDGDRENEEELDLLEGVMAEHPIPVLVLDHVRTEPPDEKAARRCYDLAVDWGADEGIDVLWYANSVDQDMPLWPFLPLKE